MTTFKSTADTDAEEYLRAYVTTADDHVLKVIYRTPLETSLFRLSLYRVGENKGDVGLDIFIAPTMARAGNGTETYNFTYYLNMDEYAIEDGYYNIYIRRCATAEDAASLKYTNSGVLNGRILNSSYDPYDKETWGDGVKSHFMTDGSGNVTQIQWSNYGFTGALNLPDFTSMELLSSWQNNYETVDLSGCTKLGKVYLYGNQITSIDLTD